MDDRWRTIPGSGSFNSDSGEALKNSALAGLGITRRRNLSPRVQIFLDSLSAHCDIS